MLDPTTSRESVDPMQRALHALRWATRVATLDPSELAHPPERPSPEELRALPLSDLRAERGRLVLGRHTQEGLDALLAVGLLEVWLPEVQAMVGFGDGEWRHKDVWKHTK